MTFFQYLFQTPLSTGPFTSLRTMKWRAEQILQKPERTHDELDRAAFSLRYAIDEHNEIRAEDEFEAYVDRLYTRGGWELSYIEGADVEIGPTRTHIRDLLQNWPDWADDKPDFIRAEDFDDLESLQDLWVSSDRPNSFYRFLDFVDDNEHESYALLALMKLEAAAAILHLPENRTPNGSFSYPVSRPLPAHETAWAGNHLIEAMVILCYAERKLAETRSAAWRAESESKREQAKQEQAELDRQAESEKKRALANIRWAEDAEKRKAAKTLIKEYWDIWTNDQTRYRSQSEFAQDLQDRIEREIGLGRNNKLLYSADTIKVKLIPKMRKTE
ncbi:MAG: hypothetical protein ACLGI6_08840 [Gammaproteobacteria bacterium]